ncbi:MAG: ABC transporter substrate-binding protein [Alphaproteobacteria bacterium]
MILDNGNVDATDLSTRLRRGSISRRGFMEGALAGGLSLAAATALMDRALAAVPKRGGTLRMGIGHGSTTDSTDPGTFDNGFVNYTFHSIHNRLTEIAADGSLVGDVAESWDASPDAKTWTFRIRKGMTFHNGKTVTARDVIASLNHHRGEDATSAAKPIVAAITDIREDDPSTIVISLEGGNADFPFIMADYHLSILPEKDGTIDLSGVGTGSYKLESFEPGVRITMSRNGDYWDDGRGHFDAVEALSIIDPNARQNALLTGSIDVADRMELKTVERVKRKPGMVVKDITGYQHYTFPMHVDVAPFNDVDVRMALKLAFKREELVNKILQGYGTVGNDHPISKANRYHNSDLPQRSYDPDKAKWHLKKAGAEGLTVELSASNAAFAGAVGAAVLYKESAAAAGINVNVIREPGDGYWSNVWLKKPWCACYWGGRPTEDQMFSTAYETGVPWNDTNWSNERFDTLLHEARAELDEARRREMYYEMQTLVSNDGGAVVPMYASYVFGHTDRLAHPDIVGGNWDFDGGRLAERWWFA